MEASPSGNVKKRAREDNDAEQEEAPRIEEAPIEAATEDVVVREPSPKRQRGLQKELLISNLTAEEEEKLNKLMTDEKEEFLCPISKELMVNPVSIIDRGVLYTFEKECIQEWISKKSTNPITNNALSCITSGSNAASSSASATSALLVSNIEKKGMINKYCEKTAKKAIDFVQQLIENNKAFGSALQLCSRVEKLLAGRDCSHLLLSTIQQLKSTVYEKSKFLASTWSQPEMFSKEAIEKELDSVYQIALILLHKGNEESLHIAESILESALNQSEPNSSKKEELMKTLVDVYHQLHSIQVRATTSSQDLSQNDDDIEQEDEEEENNNTNPGVTANGEDFSDEEEDGNDEDIDDNNHLNDSMMTQSVKPKFNFSTLPTLLSSSFNISDAPSDWISFTVSEENYKPKLVDALQKLGKYYLERGLHAKAATVLGKFFLIDLQVMKIIADAHYHMRNHSMYSMMYYIIGLCEFNADKFDEGIQTLLKVDKCSPHRYNALKEVKSTLSWMKKSLKLKEQNEISTQSSTTSASNGSQLPDYDTGMTLEDLSKLSSQIHSEMGNIKIRKYYELKYVSNWDVIERYFKHALSLDPNNEEAWLGLIEVYNLSGQFEQANEIIISHLLHKNNKAEKESKTLEAKDIILSLTNLQKVYQKKFESLTTQNSYLIETTVPDLRQRIEKQEVQDQITFEWLIVASEENIHRKRNTCLVSKRFTLAQNELSVYFYMNDQISPQQYNHALFLQCSRARTHTGPDIDLVLSYSLSLVSSQDTIFTPTITRKGVSEFVAGRARGWTKFCKTADLRNDAYKFVAFHKKDEEGTTSLCLVPYAQRATANIEEPSVVVWKVQAVVSLVKAVVRDLPKLLKLHE